MQRTDRSAGSWKASEYIKKCGDSMLKTRPSSSSQMETTKVSACKMFTFMLLGNPTGSN